MATKVFVRRLFTYFATNASFLRVIANLIQYNMQYIPCNSALLAQETMLLFTKNPKIPNFSHNFCHPVNGQCLFSNLLFSGTTHQHWPTVSQPGGRQSAEYKCNLFIETFEKLSHNILHRTLAWKKAFCLLNSGLGSGLSIKFKVIGCDNFN